MKKCEAHNSNVGHCENCGWVHPQLRERVPTEYSSREERYRKALEKIANHALGPNKMKRIAREALAEPECGCDCHDGGNRKTGYYYKEHCSYCKPTQEHFVKPVDVDMSDIPEGKPEAWFKPTPTPWEEFDRKFTFITDGRNHFDKLVSPDMVKDWLKAKLGEKLNEMRDYGIWDLNQDIRDLKKWLGL